jgi:hypothetical protein
VIIDESVKRLLGDRVARSLTAMKAACPGLDTVTISARRTGGPSIAGAPASGMHMLKMRAVGWSPSLHQCDIDARIFHRAAVEGDVAAEDMMVTRVARILARQRSRADALARLVEVEALDWPGIHDMRDEYGDAIRARLRPLPRRTVLLGTIDHLHVDSAIVHACRMKDVDVHLTAALSLQGLLKEGEHGGGRAMEHTDQRGMTCGVFETDVDGTTSPPEGTGEVPAADRHVVFDVKLDGVTVVGDRVIAPGMPPQTALHALPGRPLGDLVRVHPAIDVRTIAEAVGMTGEEGPVTVARLTPDPWPLADADDVPSA